MEVTKMQTGLVSELVGSIDTHPLFKGGTPTTDKLLIDGGDNLLIGGTDVLLIE